MEEEQLFVSAGYKDRLRPAFLSVCNFVRSTEGCDSEIYMTPKGQVRIAIFAPGEKGPKASKVFAIAFDGRDAIIFRPPQRFPPELQGEIEFKVGEPNQAEFDKLKRWKQYVE